MGMIKMITAVFALLLSVGCEQQPQTAADIINVGTSADYPPFEFMHNGKVEGLDIDVIEAVAKKLGKKVVVSDMAFDTLIPAVQSGRIDVGASSFTVTDERSQHVDFSDVYYQTRLALLSHSDHPYTNLEEAANKVVGTQTGSIMEVYLKSKAEPLHIDIFSISNNRLLVEELRLARIDAVLLEKSQAKQFAVINPELKYYELEPTDNGYAFVFHKGSPLVSEFNKALLELRKDGVLEQIKNKWLK